MRSTTRESGCTQRGIVIWKGCTGEAGGTPAVPVGNSVMRPEV
jgi:hypothetical protein